MKKILPLLVILLLISACAPAQSADLVQRDVFYAGADGGVKTALSLAMDNHKKNLAYTARSLSLLLERDALADFARLVSRTIRAIC
ncbi:MAG: hypothetical protein HY867_14155 [Chloroflexi bacterium]|nr:hypothetical protein [Chloroflexota bacterium]